ncbi:MULTISPECIES: lactaldehyde reductase [Vibrio]|uniref:lactaldehyde reductase n=1 Tax=Vibrio TaxID=662 RepID=UPI0001541C01|nr:MULTISPECIES: lactaldehyde reductase [Vibrio]EDL53631.1 alcohol dehydrogenase, class IV [Vibrio mediterranei AK1]MCF4173205.1 lactaldehyde reductase [Vibrio sp. McD22-P3]MCG9657151.1 lactaldehyde reductase [Vibrio mediterranei]MCG9665087.1 lactaldehyde reductase [Vibrio mediterranei]MCY9874205.1 lactaldehyde reductase [Vibrio barjaei]
MAFSLNLPKLSLAGAGAINDAVQEIQAQSINTALIVTDANLVKLGILDSLLAQLEQLSIDYVLFDKVTPNPTAALVREGVELYQKEQCDCFIAVGGGSPVDCAKAIRIVTSNGGDICDYEGVGKVRVVGDYFVAVNTTAGTAAEMTSNSVITDEERQVKMVIIDAKQIPDLAVNDPELMLGLPSSVTASTGMDALTHAIEAYVTPGAHTLTKPTALEAIRLINKWLPVAVDDGQNLEAREQLACAQFLAGMAFNSAGLGLVHAMAHQPGATHNLPHGVCNAILLPEVCEFNAQTRPQPFRAIAEAMGSSTADLDDESAAKAAIARIRQLSQRVQIPNGLAELGIQESDFALWLDKTLADPCLGGNPRVPTREEILKLFAQAM